jgi:hypothetical protein
VSSMLVLLPDADLGQKMNNWPMDTIQWSGVNLQEKKNPLHRMNKLNICFAAREV